MQSWLNRSVGGIAVLLVLALPGPAVQAAGAQQCGGTDGGLALPPGFCATVFADKLGHARHMAAAANGVVYVNTWSGVYYGNDTPPPGGFLIALRDTNGDGRADEVTRFGPSAKQGSGGGTGIGLYRGALYAEVNDRIVRYALPTGAAVPTGEPETIVSGLPLTGDHPMHPFAIDADGTMYVDLASATNSCQEQNRMPASPGINPCTELETRGGIWRYDANRTGQKFSPAERFATGIRNADGIAIDPRDHTLYSTQHGRDQLSENWGNLYTPEQGANLPAEELLRIRRGGDYGWPECYFDDRQGKLVLAPEYGGDGGRKVGECAGKLPPAAAFPGHWAPNDVVIYTGTQFPTAYQGGAFIAFHGSWNRAPFPQGGYCVVFQPLADGKASGPFVVFADGFAGAVKAPGAAEYRPSGVTVGPDGALYVSDDVRGRIWRIVYRGGDVAAKVQGARSAGGGAGVAADVRAPGGGAAGAGEAAVAGGSAGAAGGGGATPPEGIHPNAGSATTGPVPPGATARMVAVGERIFRGEVGGAPCAGCHGINGAGSPVGPNLTRGKWIWGDGSLKAIKTTINNGVPKPKNFPGAMPPKGGAQLTPEQVDAVAAYVWSIGHAGVH
jgi:glucose/arabinose dehydrogenase/mono/diheme cytochrome c family protein